MLHQFGSQLCDTVLALTTKCIILEKGLNLSEFWFPHLSSEHNNTSTQVVERIT
jgi:hypothetical protein